MPPTLRRGAAELEAVGVLAEHARRRARQACVWVFAHPAGPHSEASFEEIVSACTTPGAPPVTSTAARTLAARAAADRRRRFPRGATQVEPGLHVLLHATVSIVAYDRAGGRLDTGAERALVELAEMVARLLVVPAPKAAAEEDQSMQEALQVRTPVAYGARLADVLELLESPPILAESRLRLGRAFDPVRGSIGQVTRVVETDLGLAIAIVTAANGLEGRPRGGIDSIPDAVEALGKLAVLRIASGLPVLRPRTAADNFETALIAMSAHAITTRAAADLIARQIGETARDAIRLGAVLHDIGKLALAAASGDYLDAFRVEADHPEERIAEERRRLGIDHAALGAVAVQRLGLPKAIGTAVERHHADDASGPAAIVRLADMLAHEAAGHAVRPLTLAAVGRSLRLDAADLQRLSYDLARSREPLDRAQEPSPLTPMQQKVLEGLAAGNTYKQIAAGLSLSESTVRSHLHQVYSRLGVTDRAQAVLLATERGWI